MNFYCFYLRRIGMRAVASDAVRDSFCFVFQRILSIYSAFPFSSCSKGKAMQPIGRLDSFADEQKLRKVSPLDLVR